MKIVRNFVKIIQGFKTLFLPGVRITLLEQNEGESAIPVHVDNIAAVPTPEKKGNPRANRLIL
jgi:hypothetical protein